MTERGRGEEMGNAGRRDWGRMLKSVQAFGVGELGRGQADSQLLPLSGPGIPTGRRNKFSPIQLEMFFCFPGKRQKQGELEPQTLDRLSWVFHTISYFIGDKNEITAVWLSFWLDVSRSGVFVCGWLLAGCPESFLFFSLLHKTERNEGGGGCFLLDQWALCGARCPHPALLHSVFTPTQHRRSLTSSDRLMGAFSLTSPFVETPIGHSQPNRSLISWGVLGREDEGVGAVQGPRSCAWTKPSMQTRGQSHINARPHAGIVFVLLWVA